MRTGKTVTFGNSTYNYSYVYEGGMLLQMTRNNYTYDFSYDTNGAPIGFKYTAPSGSSSQYYYGTNSRGDIVAIYNSAGTKIATYSYDAYGKPLTTTFIPSSLSATIKNIINNNPLRYRGYVYDTETGFYYLQSRYYDPTTCRFINEDGYYDTGRGFNGYNMFAYCNNNPIMSYDPSGTRELVGGGPISTETKIERTLSCSDRRKWYQEQNPYGAATEYTPTKSKNFNCLAYIVGSDEAIFVGGYANSVKDFDVNNVSDMFISTIENMGMSIRPIVSYDSLIYPNEYRVAMRTNNSSDYHFMMQHSDGSWSHKPGPCASRLIEGRNPSVVDWYGVVFDPNSIFGDGDIIEIETVSGYYNSATLYYAISK